MTGPCSCWQQPSLHSGHCCWADPDHNYSPGAPLPCGHDVDGRIAAVRQRAWSEPDLFEAVG